MSVEDGARAAVHGYAEIENPYMPIPPEQAHDQPIGDGEARQQGNESDVPIAVEDQRGENDGDPPQIQIVVPGLSHVPEEASFSYTRNCPRTYRNVGSIFRA